MIAGQGSRLGTGGMASKLAAAKIAAEVEGSRIVVWPDVAHVPTLERPADFEGLALDFLTGR